MGSKESDVTDRLSVCAHTHTHMHTHYMNTNQRLLVAYFNIDSPFFLSKRT